MDVGGTFTDLVASDGETLSVVKVASTPPDFERGVIEAVGRVVGGAEGVRVVHGSTVATNALLQRAGADAAFITTDGFRDMLLIGRQNRPELYALQVERHAPAIRAERCFTVAERVAADGSVVTPLTDEAVAELVDRLRAAEVEHVAVCLLFSFVNPDHERRIGAACEAAGMTVSLSCDVLPEFREYERASTTAVTATLRPTVARYLEKLDAGLPPAVGALRILHGGGGTLSPRNAAEQAGRLVLSGPAGGVMGAAFVARLAGFEDVIAYDMGGTSTDVALIRAGRPQWTTRHVIDGLPVGLAMFDIHTVGAGGGSVAYVDAGGALRVGPRSAGAVPGPACYGRGGAEPTVTDANLLLGRIPADSAFGDGMTLDRDAAALAVESLSLRIGKPMVETALGIVRVAEASMARAVRAVSSRRGHDPRRFALVSFGGAGGLHACAVAEGLEMRTVIVPPYCGVLSALGMVVAPSVADVGRTVAHLRGSLDDARLAAEFDALDRQATEQVAEAEVVEKYADARLVGQSHEVQVRLDDHPTRAGLEAAFFDGYRALYGAVPAGRAVEVVTLRLRRIGPRPDLTLPAVEPSSGPPRRVQLVTADGSERDAPAFTRAGLVALGETVGPLLLVDAEATAYVPPGWSAAGRADGTVVAGRG